MSGKTEEATRLYKELIEKFPNDSSLLENYLTLLLFSENLEESEKQYQILSEKFPDNANLQSLSDKIEKLREKLQPKIRGKTNRRLPFFLFANASCSSTLFTRPQKTPFRV